MKPGGGKRCNDEKGRERTMLSLGWSKVSGFAFCLQNGRLLVEITKAWGTGFEKRLVEEEHWCQGVCDLCMSLLWMWTCRRRPSHLSFIPARRYMILRYVPT